MLREETDFLNRARYLRCEHTVRKSVSGTGRTEVEIRIRGEGMEEVVVTGRAVKERDATRIAMMKGVLELQDVELF